MRFKDFIDRLAGRREPKRSSAIEDYIELEFEGDTSGTPRGVERVVKVCKMKGFADVNTSAQELSNGNVVILDVKPLAERSMNELKHAVEEMKEVCISMGGDIAGLSEYHLIMTPPSIKIERTTGKTDEFEATMERVKSRMRK